MGTAPYAYPAFAPDGFAPAEGVAADAALLLELCPTPPPPPPSAAAAAEGAEGAEGAEAEEGVQPGPQSSLQAADLDPLLASFKEHKESDLATSERLAAVYDAVTADEAPCGHARPTRTHARPTRSMRVQPAACSSVAPLRRTRSLLVCGGAL